MRKYLFIAFAFSLLFVSSCSKDDNDDMANFDYDTNILFGTWKIVKYENVAWPFKTTTATFNSNGTYSGSGYFGNGSGTYKLSGKRITCYVDGKIYVWYDVVSLNDSTCVLDMSDDSATINITCQKQ